MTIQKNSAKRKIETILAYLFFLFFVVEILSPMIQNRAFYLEYVIAFINPFFWCWLSEKKLSYRMVCCGVCIIAIVAIGHPWSAIKIILAIFGAVYLAYLWERHLWKLNVFLFASIAVALVQLALYFYDRSLAIAIGPSVIARAVWGSYAMSTYTNFYPIFGTDFPRVAGLGREAGFLASLIVSASWLLYLRVKSSSEKNITVKGVMYFLGYIASFSKTSFSILGVWTVHKFRRWIDMVPAGLVVFLWVAGCVTFFTLFSSQLLESDGISGAFLIRFGAYASMLSLEPSDFLFGVNGIDKIDSVVASAAYHGEGFFLGLGAWILSDGILAPILWVIALWFLGVTPTGFLVLLLLTINVNPNTDQNSAVLAYYIIFQYYRHGGSCEKTEISARE